MKKTKILIFLMILSSIVVLSTACSSIKNNKNTQDVSVIKATENNATTKQVIKSDTKTTAFEKNGTTYYKISESNFNTYVSEREKEVTDFIHGLNLGLDVETEPSEHSRRHGLPIYWNDIGNNTAIIQLYFDSAPKNSGIEGSTSFSLEMFVPKVPNKEFNINDYPIVTKFIKLATKNDNYDFENLNKIAKEILLNSTNYPYGKKIPMELDGLKGLYENIKIHESKEKDSYTIKYDINTWNSWDIE